MRGVVILGNRRLAIKDFDRPVPGANQVLIRMRAASICGSDMHFYRSTPEELGDRAKWIAGHEVAGDVVSRGRSVDSLDVGDRVSVFHISGCKSCEMCKKGYAQYCLTPGGYLPLAKGQSVKPWRSSGGMADYVLAPAEICHKLPKGVSYLDGAILGCGALTAFSIIDKLGITARDSVALYGLGPVGLCALLIMKALGASVIGIDIKEERLKLAQKLGLESGVDASKPGVVDRVLGLSEGNRGVDVALDFSGSPEAINNAIRSVRSLGKVGLVGIGPRIGEASITPSSFMLRDVWITGILVSNVNLWFDLIRLMARKNLSFSPIVTETFPLTKAPEAFKLFDTLTTGKIAFVAKK